MRLLVTGRHGQIASCLAELAARDSMLTVIFAGRPELDLTRPQDIGAFVARERPDAVVSAAAYTAVDRAEDEPELAFAVNAAGAGAVAAAAAAIGIPVIHLSTDYVYDGTKAGAYLETDPTRPLSVYGATKLEGENRVAAANVRHVILRTAWVYSAHGNNFVRTMLRLAGEGDEIDVVSDQLGNPTSAHDIAEGIVCIARMLKHESSAAHFGVFHLAGTGETNWSGFARHVFEVSRRLEGPFAAVRDIATSSYPTKAKRPANSRLDTAKLQAVYNWTAPAWRDSTARVVGRLLSAR